MQYYFVSDIANNNVILCDDDKYHLIKVMRCKIGTRFVAVFEKMKYICQVNNIEPFSGTLIEKINEDIESEVQVTAIVPMIKSQNLELAVQKITELGVARIVIVKTRRSNHLYSAFRRLKKIVKEAAEQSHRNVIPEIIEKELSTKDVIDYKSELNVYFNMDGTILSKDTNSARTVTYICGPEGGFDQEELEFLEQNGFINCKLTKSVLRSETAIIVAAFGLTNYK